MKWAFIMCLLVGLQPEGVWVRCWGGRQQTCAQASATSRMHLANVLSPALCQALRRASGTQR